MKDDHIINEIISARQYNEKLDTDTSEGGVDINALVDDIFWWGIIIASPKEKNLMRMTPQFCGVRLNLIRTGEYKPWD